MAAQPDDLYPPHTDCEEEVAAFLTASGFLVASSTYHGNHLPCGGSLWERASKERLQKIGTPTAYYVRGRADRCAIHRELPLVFQWEAKTGPKYPNIALELEPLATHMDLAEIHGILCLYAYNDLVDGRRYGFWCHDMPRIHDITIPGWRMGQQQTGAELDRLYRLARRRWPDLQDDWIWVGDRFNGSNDPWVIIRADVKQQLPDWRDLILQAAEEMAQPQPDVLFCCYCRRTGVLLAPGRSPTKPACVECVGGTDSAP